MYKVDLALTKQKIWYAMKTNLIRSHLFIQSSMVSSIEND